jgi:cyclohexyl-isocyanide hydratase
MSDTTYEIGLLLFPQLTQLDLTGPFEVFSRVPGARVHLLWKRREPVSSDRGLVLQPTGTLAMAPRLDLVCVPGGPGQVDLMDDVEVLDFLREQDRRGTAMTSVCTGSLVLAAAGLLHGCRATCHWASLDQLALLGAIPVAQRVVHDRGRITGAGVTSGIDFALAVVAERFGPDVARGIALAIEYDPQPPFGGSSARTAPAALVAEQRRLMQGFLDRRKAATLRAAGNLVRRPPR